MNANLERRLADGGASAQRAMVELEVRRTRVFLVSTASLAVVGAGASWLFDGNVAWRHALSGTVLGLLVVYAMLWRRVRNASGFDPWVAAYVVSLCNLAGVTACFYFGLFSPAPMILMLPVSFVGHSGSRGAALAAYAVAAVSVGVPMLVVSLGFVADPGLLRADGLGWAERVAYAGLVQSVLLTSLLSARGSARASEAVIHGLTSAQARVRQREEQLAEVNEQLDRALETGRAGPLTGGRLGDWTLGGLLGRGAMGDVYAARHGLTAGEAALKVLNPAAAEDPAAFAMVRREAETLGRIDDRHVVRLIEVVFADPPWIAMERLRGESLADLLRRERRLGLGDVARLVLEVAAGLDAAARANVLHRDIKPSNLFHCDAPGGRLWKILDFGMAKHLGDDLTRTRGLLVGTPGYIPPEAASGQGVDSRGDVWSLAAVAYRALTGARPFPGRAQALLAATVSQQAVRPSFWPGVPADVDPVFAIGLAKDPRDRFASAGELAGALLDAADGRVSPALARRAARVLGLDPFREQPAPSGTLP